MLNLMVVVNINSTIFYDTTHFSGQTSSTGQRGVEIKGT